MLLMLAIIAALANSPGCAARMGARAAAVCPVAVSDLRGRKVERARRVCTHRERYDAWDRRFRQR
jgi:hypothetical protein